MSLLSSNITSVLILWNKFFYFLNYYIKHYVHIDLFKSKTKLLEKTQFN